MNVKVNYYGQARRLTGKSGEAFSLAEGAAIIDAVTAMGQANGKDLNDLLLDDAGAIRRTIMVSGNGTHVRDQATPLNDDDELDLHTPLAGG